MGEETGLEGLGPFLASSQLPPVFKLSQALLKGIRCCLDEFRDFQGKIMHTNPMKHRKHLWHYMCKSINRVNKTLWRLMSRLTINEINQKNL